jgi:hypothetical protein
LDCSNRSATLTDEGSVSAELEREPIDHQRVSSAATSSDQSEPEIIEQRRDVLFQSPRTLLGQDLAHSRAAGEGDLLDRLARADDLPDFGRVLRGDDVEYTGRETGLLGELRD